MPCSNKISSSRYVVPHPISFGSDWRALPTAFIAFIEAFYESFEMRRTAHRQRPFFDE